LTDSPRRRRGLGEQVQWIAELAERSVESDHDRARIDARLTSVREALEAGPSLAAENHPRKLCQK
jgi:hypothetical protein